MNTQPLKLFLGLSVAAVATVAAPVANAQQAGVPYVIDQRGAIVKDPYGLCWRTGYWTPAQAVCECDKDILPREKCEPPAPAPRAQPAPPPVAAPAKPAPKALVVRSTEFFDFDKAILTDKAKATLDKEIVARLPEFSSVKIISVEGHTDRIGTQQYNQKLSERRAEAVKAYLVSKGADSSKIEAIGMGKTVPQKSCPDPSKAGPIKTFKELIECLAPNRRAVVEVQGTAR
ncbi:MAG: OmpA family protein [Burkholderiales bacterium]|nr:OmpA family protein [Burkholderiales bacterium]